MKFCSRLSAAEWAVVAEATLLLPCAAAAVRIVPLGRAARLMVLCPRLGFGGDVPPARVAQLVAAAGARLRCRCLPQALVTSRLLAGRGVSGAVIIGTARAGGQLRAHAWVDVEGRPMDAGDLSSYEPIYRLGVHDQGRRAA